MTYYIDMNKKRNNKTKTKTKRATAFAVFYVYLPVFLCAIVQGMCMHFLLMLKLGKKKNSKKESE